MNESGATSTRSGGGAVLGAVGITTLITGAGYLLTLVQQGLYSRALGVNGETDALGASLAWAIGSSGLVGTTLMSVFLPVYVRAVAGAEDGGQSLRRRATIFALGSGIALAGLTVVGAPVLARVLAPAADPAAVDRLATMLVVAAPLDITWLLVWLAVATANARERYVLAAASFIAPPVPLIAVLVVGVTAPEAVLGAYIAGTILQLAVLWLAEPATRPSIRRGSPSSVDPAIGRDLLPVGAAFALLTLVPLEVRGLASFGGTGAVATADYASRLALAGQQVLLSGVLAVTFTRWSGRSQRLGSSRSMDSVDRTLWVVAVGGVAVIVLLPLVATSLVHVVLAGGRFTGADADAVGSFLAWSAPGIAGHMLLMTALRALLADRRFRPLLAAAAVAAFSTAVVGAVAQDQLGLNGVALGYSTGYLLSGLVAFVAARRHAGVPAGPRDAAVAPVPVAARLASEKRP